MTMQADVIILGAGPAGSTAGTLLARGGFRVILLDRATFPREKPCGGLLSPRGVRAVERVFGRDALERITVARSAAARMSCRGEFVAEIAGTGEMRFIRREESDAAFVACAREAGCDVREGCEAVALHPNSGVVRLRSGETLDAWIVLAADGVHSFVRRHGWPRGARSRRDLAFGLTAETPLETLKPELRDACARMPHIDFGAVPWGYGWIFPRGGRVSIGVAGLRRRDTDFRAAARAFVEANCVSGAFEQIAWRGHPIPFGDFEPRPGRGNVLLVGDAAGFAEPVTGEGIAYALESAELAAGAATRALAAGKPERAGELYSDACRRSLLPHFAGALRARRLLYSPLALPLAMNALRRKPERARWFFEVADGTLTYGQYLRRLARSMIGF